MKFRPLYDNVLLKRVQVADQTSGGLYIPESAKDKPQEAEVLAVGPGRRNNSGEVVKMSVNVGDIVLFGKYTGKEVKLQGTEHIILRESEILAIIER